jgi:hypothetical protein
MAAEFHELKEKVGRAPGVLDNMTGSGRTRFGGEKEDKSL